MDVRRGIIRFLLLLALIGVGSVGAMALDRSGSMPARVSAADQGKDDAEKGNGKDKPDKDKEKEKGEKKPGPVEAARRYAIDVACEYETVDDYSTCTFAGIALEGAKKVNHLVVPAETLCADVLGGDGTYVDPDPNMHVTGYRWEGNIGAATLILDGEVTTGGTATYWFKAGGNIFPVNGPGFDCAERAAAPAAPGTPEAPSPSPTPDVTDSSGAVLVQVYACPIADAVEEYDWFGACTPVGANQTFLLAPHGGEEAPGRTAVSSAAGQAQFGDVAPGTYALTLVDAQWCHAESDGVDADGNVTVSAGERTTVWIFQCASG